MTTIAITGTKELQSALKNMTAEMEKAVQMAVDATGLELRGDVVKRYNQGPASGQVYRKYQPNRVHQASAPGQAPMTDTGRLAGSVIFERDGPLVVSVGSRLAYAAWLEYGTRDIAPRPAWVPASVAMEPKFHARMEQALGVAFK